MPQAPTDSFTEAPPRRGAEAPPAVSDHVRLEADLVTAEAGPARERVELASGRGRTVLVVDDDADMRRYLKRCLAELETVDVCEAADGLAALERARGGGIDLIVSDVVMPRLDGIGLCRALQADAALSGIPVLLITAEGAPPGLPGGAGGVLAKPFDAVRLRATVDRLLAPP